MRHEETLFHSHRTLPTLLPYRGDTGTQAVGMGAHEAEHSGEGAEPCLVLSSPVEVLLPVLSLHTPCLLARSRARPVRVVGLRSD